MASSDDHGSDSISASSNGDSSYDEMCAAGLFEEDYNRYAWSCRFDRRRMDWDYHVQKLIHEKRD